MGATDIANDSCELDSFLFDSARSLVLYPKAGAIAIFDLKKRQSREIALPVSPLSLLDQTQVGTGHLVAYVAAGPCEPEASSGEAESQRLATLRAGSARPTHVCFVQLR